MASSYPGALDTFVVPTSGTLGGTSPTLHDVEQKAADALAAIQATLGTSPQGTDATVKARLDRIESSAPHTHASTHATGGTDPVTPANIGAATTASVTSAVSAHVTAGHPLIYSPVRGGTTPPGWWFRTSAQAFPTPSDGALEGDMLVVR